MKKTAKSQFSLLGTVGDSVKSGSRQSDFIMGGELTVDEAKNEPLLGGHLSPELNLFDHILP